MKKLTTEEFKIKSIEKHNGEYNYSKSQYIFKNTPTIIIRSIHGEFSQKSGDHLGGSRCQKCSGETSTYKKNKLIPPTKEEYERILKFSNNKIREDAPISIKRKFTYQEDLFESFF